MVKMKNEKEKVVKDQLITDKYVIYNGDCCRVLSTIPDESVGFVIYSPPFASLYSYSDDPADMANCKTYEEFLEHYSFLVGELHRILLPGRITAVHCMDLPTYKRNGEEIGLSDFPGDIIRIHQKHDFVYHSRVTIWKDPLIAATRTKAIGLAHKQIVKDSAMCRTGIADYILAFRKKGENPKPIAHKHGLTVHHGSMAIPNKIPDSILPFGENGEPSVIGYVPAKDKRSQWIWQKMASPVWMDIRQTKVLAYRKGKAEDDQRHVAPLQVDVVNRCLELWSAKGDIVLSPFAGIGTEIFCSVAAGRKAIGIELKDSYFRQMKRNLSTLESRGEKLAFENETDD